MTNEEAEKLLQDTANRLGEQFDAVQIMATWHEGGITKCTRRGCGNHYARIGMAREFLNADYQIDQAHEIASRIEPPDDSESWKK